jgi:hypothetical protein
LRLLAIPYDLCLGIKVEFITNFVTGIGTKDSHYN